MTTQLQRHVFEIVLMSKYRLLVNTRSHCKILMLKQFLISARQWEGNVSTLTVLLIVLWPLRCLLDLFTGVKTRISGTASAYCISRDICCRFELVKHWLNGKDATNFD